MNSDWVKARNLDFLILKQKIDMVKPDVISAQSTSNTSKKVILLTSCAKKENSNAQISQEKSKRGKKSGETAESSHSCSGFVILSWILGTVIL